MDKDKEERQDIVNFIESLESLDKFKPFITKKSDIPKPKDDIELEIQNLVIQSGFLYNQKAVDSLADTIRSAEKIRSWKINKILWTYIVVLLFEIFQKEKSKMTAMKISFLYGMAFHASSKWKEIDEDEI